MATTTWYRQALLNAAKGAVNWNSDAIKVQLHNATYVPNYDTHAFKSDLTNEVTGTNYTAGGVTLAGKAVTYTAANSFATTWVASTAYNVGDVFRPVTGNGKLYQVIVAGNSGATEPTYPTVNGQDVANGTMTIQCVGSGVIALTASPNPSWNTVTVTFQYAIVIDTTPATDATRPLLMALDYGSNQVLSAANLTIQPGTLGFGIIFTP